MSEIKSYKKKNGKTCYEFHTYLGIDQETGKKVRVTRRGFNSQKEAKSELAKLRYEFNNNIYNKTSSIKYKELYKLWSEIYNTTVKASTVNWVTRIFEKHILPVIGEKPITTITGVECQNLYNNLTNNYSKGSVYYNYAKKCYDYAIAPLRVANNNPFNMIYKAKPRSTKESKKIEFLELNELQDLLECIKLDESILWYTYFSLIGYTGLRRNEALALEWSDIDFRNQNLTVNKSLTRDVNNKYIVGTPKNIHSLRTISLDNNLCKILKEWKKYQSQLPITNIKPLIFNNTKGSYITSSQPLKVLKRVIQRNNLKNITVHGLRHSHTCHLFDAGIGLKEVQDRLGHTDIATTMETYNHVTDYRKDKSINQFEEYIKSTSNR